MRLTTLQRAASLGLLLFLPIGAFSASFPPDLHFSSVSTPRVTVHFHQGLEPLARQAAALATEILESHEGRYHTFVGMVHIVLADVQDDPNGFATPLPYPLVYLRAAAPDGSDDFGTFDSWLRLVLTHELAHIVHLNQAHGVLGFGRRVFGRAPFLFPNALTPTWMVEGLATYEETRGTAFGRGRSSDFRMILRMAALDNKIGGEDRAVQGRDLWPGGEAAYVFGEAFLQDLSERFGEQTLPEFARVHSGRVIPYVDDLTSIRVTGASFHTRWRQWIELEQQSAERAAEGIRARGLTPSEALTTRGIRQVGPRFSPDGSSIAYTSYTLTRFPAIRVMGKDGKGDRKITDRNGGTALSWSPDGTTLVYDEPDVVGFFATYSDLKAVDVKSGRVRRLTHGLRARSPDVSPDARRVLFVRRLPDRTELAVKDLDGSGFRDLTKSEAGTEWGDPHWSPTGESIVASRLSPGGWLDIVTVDPTTGDATELTHDRARDVEPTWARDGAHIVFRSDRDGVSNLYACRLADGALFRVTNVLGGAFDPDVSPDGGLVAFSSYSAQGYDVHVMDLDLSRLPSAAPFDDPYGHPGVLPEPEPGAATPYRPFPTLLPRFWSPFVATSSSEWLYGAATAGGDPLFRHIYGVEVHRGFDSGRTSAIGLYQYDRFWPTFLLTARDTTEFRSDASLLRRQEIDLVAALPVQRSLRSVQTVSLAWRRRRDTLERSPRAGQVDLGGVEVAWGMSNAKRYPFSISPVDGWQLRLAYLREDPALGSVVSLSKVTADARGYLRLTSEESALAVRLGGGATLGDPRFKDSFTIGGFPNGALFDVVDTNFTVLRGYPDDAFVGRSFAHANVEYRFPFGHPERGFRSFPVFLRHLHGALFGDAASAWSGGFHLGDVKTAAGVAIGADTFVSHGLPVTATVGVARGFSQQGETRFYLRLGLAF
jgi:Tol biopolymer transport system component